MSDYYLDDALEYLKHIPLKKKVIEEVQSAIMNGDIDIAHFIISDIESNVVKLSYNLIMNLDDTDNWRGNENN